VGKKLAQARTKIARAHCRIGKVTRKPSAARTRGRVLKQSPRPGRRLANRAKVNLVIGKGRR